MSEQYRTSESFAPDGLIGGDYPRVCQPVTIASGAGVLKRGTVLGKITASGKSVKSASASADGSQVPDTILAQDVDATSADIAATAYASGEFVESALILGTGHTLDSIRDGLRDKNIYLVKSK